MLGYMQDIGFEIFCFVLLLFSVAYVFFNIGIVHASPKFESQKMIYKQDTEFEIFSSLANCFHLYFIGINFNHMFLSSVDNFIDEHIKSVQLTIVCHEQFCQRNGYSILYKICKQI